MFLMLTWKLYINFGLNCLLHT